MLEYRENKKIQMKYLFGENRFVYTKLAFTPEGGLPNVEPGDTKPKEDKEKKKIEIELVKNFYETRKNEATNATKNALKNLDPIKSLSQKEVENAFSFAGKDKFDEKKVVEMLSLSDKMAVYDLWRGGISRLKNESGLKDNQGFDRMAAQFAKQEVDDRGRAYLKINLYGKNKFEMNIGAGHICPPSWTSVAIVDGSGNIKIGTRKVPGKDSVDGHKVGYYDEKGEYLAVYSGYKVYPVSVLSDTETKDKKVITEQVEKESEFYTKNKSELEKYASNSESYGVAQMEMSKFEIQKIRDKMPSLEDIKNPGERVSFVAKWIAENENIYAKHCGNWVDRVYLIAGVTSKKGLYHNLQYAKGPDGKLGASRDAREGAHALKENPRLVDNLKVGDWLWINNRNSFDVAGNHSVIFVGWKDKAARIAYCANWLNNSKKGQKISIVDFSKTPITHIESPSAVEDKFTRVSQEEVKQQEVEQALHGRESVGNLKQKGKDYAREVENKFGVPWQVTYAMFILESGAGTSNLARNENAFFGIKAKPGDRNATREYGGAQYRKYESMEASFSDYGQTVTNGRYKEAVKYKNNPMMCLAVVLGAGYCPDKDYFSKIVQIWKREGIRDIGFISQGDLEKSLNNVAHRERSVDTYVQELSQPAQLQVKFYDIASQNGLLRA